MAPVLDRWAKSRTICWGCANAYGQCSWSKRFEPVDGWEAERRVRYYNTPDGEKRVYMDSFTVMACPLYEAEKRARAF